MFTGIVEEVGSILSLQKTAQFMKLGIQGDAIFSDLKEGQSVATNGVCLTVTAIQGKVFFADVMYETLRRSNLGILRIGSQVNLERAMQVGDRFGGHMVTGHIDGVGKLCRIQKESIATLYTIQADPGIMAYIIQKGSVTIDGISLTIMGMTKDTFTVSIIPHTASQTTLSKKKIGDKVNLENDVIGKYVEKLMGDKPQTMTRTFLQDNGF